MSHSPLRPVRRAARAALLTAALALAPALAHAGGLALVALPGTFSVPLASAEVRALFLGETTYEKKTRVTLVLRRGDDPLERQFIERVLNISENRFAAHWIRMVFRGDAAPPVEVDNEAALTARVTSTPGALAVMTATEARRHPELVTVYTVPDGGPPVAASGR